MKTQGTDINPSWLSLAAAHQAADATAELLRHAREGEGLDGPFEIEVVEKLLDATKLAIEAMGDAGSRHSDIYGAIAAELGLDAVIEAGTAAQVHNVEELRLAASAIRRHMPDTLPANDAGQIHFARALAEAAADAIEYALTTSAASSEIPASSTDNNRNSRTNDQI